MGDKNKIILHPLDGGKKKTLGTLVCFYIFIFRAFLILLFSFVVLNQSGTHQIKLPNAN